MKLKRIFLCFFNIIFGVAHNYLLALRNREYERAYSYLSPRLANYPEDVGEFETHIEFNSWNFPLDRDASLEIQSVRASSNRTTVVVRESTFSGGDIWLSIQSRLPPQ